MVNVQEDIRWRNSKLSSNLIDRGREWEMPENGKTFQGVRLESFGDFLFKSCKMKNCIIRTNLEDGRGNKIISSRSVGGQRSDIYNCIKFEVLFDVMGDDRTSNDLQSLTMRTGWLRLTVLLHRPFLPTAEAVVAPDHVIGHMISWLVAGTLIPHLANV